MLDIFSSVDLVTVVVWVINIGMTIISINLAFAGIDFAKKVINGSFEDRNNRH